MMPGIGVTSRSGIIGLGRRYATSVASADVITECQVAESVGAEIE